MPFYFKFLTYLFSIMIETSSTDPEILKYEENIAKILDRAVKLFRKTNLEELADKWDRILKTYNAKKNNQ